MEYSRIEILPGVWLSHLREDKFKTASFSVNLLTQLSQETASLNALIPYVLRRGTASCPDMEAIGARLDDLYGSSIEPIVRKIGEIQCVGFYSNFPEDELLPADSQVRRRMISFCAEMLLSPMTRGGLLLPAYVESEREKLAELLAARINNKRTWAVVRCIEEMFRYEAFRSAASAPKRTAVPFTIQSFPATINSCCRPAPLSCSTAAVLPCGRSKSCCAAPLPHCRAVRSTMRSAPISA